MSLVETALTLAAGGGATGAGTLFVQWFRDRRSGETQITEHRDGLTLDLLRAAREEMSELRKEMGDQRALSAKAAHIDEALDHIYALLHADGEIEFRAASRRAAAFLKRMRPDPAEQKGELRNSVQTQISAERVVKDQKGEP